ncbi:autotransporter domain-containing protein [Pseudomonas sp. LJDD11]|uniref:esterase EstP n=1 Tax=Pseudomonas sp. LJDD11 TaxID=2931984 RepID=UPI00211C69F9|nr:esterase EstP [Pseudomonas sp. LJDD11]MCQ9425997.1 autotransporter domain-containing protein [Pseudomonas sp. LJDD11]
MRSLVSPFSSLRKPLLACLLSLGCLPTPGTAAPYSTLFVFGDSLADAGQFPDLAGPSGASLRFTNRTGPTYGSGEMTGYSSSTLLGMMLGIAPADLNASTSPLNAALGLPDGNNWAVGGYRTDQILAAITSQSSVVDPNSGTTLRTRPGYLPGNNFRADPDALYYLTGGGNDFLQGRVLSASDARAAGGRLADSAQTLQQAGARYIMVWLLPDIGQTPAFSGNPAQPLVSQLSAAFNSQLVAQLAQIDAQIIPLNIPLFISETLADPARYGFAANTNLIGTCFSGDSCTANPIYGLNGSSPDPSKLFFNDRVHPTTAAQQLLADYGWSILSAPWELTLLPEMGHSTLRSQQDELRSQWLADFGAWQPIGQWRSLVAAGGQHLDIDAQSSGAQADGRGYNLTLGGSYRFAEHWRSGLVAGAYRQSLKAGTLDSHYRLNGYIASAFLQYQANNLWADLAASGGRLDYDRAERKFALGVAEAQQKGDTDGHLWALSARLGYDLAGANRPWHLSPFISADYARVNVDGYRELGNGSTALTIDDQERTSKRAGVGLLGKWQLSNATQVFGEIAHEREFETDPQQLRMALTSLSSINFELQGYEPQRNLNRASLGVAHKISRDLSLRANYNWRKNDELTQQGVSVGVSLDF